MSPERALWSAVINQAIIDALAPATDIESRRAHLSAVRWFRHPGRDFRLACACAGVDPDAVSAKVTAALSDPAKARDLIARMYAGGGHGRSALVNDVRGARKRNTA